MMVRAVHAPRLSLGVERFGDAGQKYAHGREPLLSVGHAVDHPADRNPVIRRPTIPRISCYQPI